MYKDDKLIFLMGEKKKGGGTDNNKHFPEQEQGTEDTHLYMHRCSLAREHEARHISTSGDKNIHQTHRAWEPGHAPRTAQEWKFGLPAL